MSTKETKSILSTGELIAVVFIVLLAAITLSTMKKNSDDAAPTQYNERPFR